MNPVRFDCQLQRYDVQVEDEEKDEEKDEIREEY